MFVLFVQFRVKPEHVDAFRKASIENARHSAQEPGVARFDLIQDLEDASRFVCEHQRQRGRESLIGIIVIEVFRSAEAHAAHRETDHYLTWRDTVADMTSEPRSAIKYVSVYPDDSAW